MRGKRTYSVSSFRCSENHKLSGSACHWVGCENQHVAYTESIVAARSIAAEHAPAWIFRENIKSGLGTLVETVY